RWPAGASGGVESKRLTGGTSFGGAPRRAEWRRARGGLSDSPGTGGVGSRAGHPLAARLVEQNGGGNGGVQRFHAHGGDGDMGRRRAPLRADAMGFAEIGRS